MGKSEGVRGRGGGHAVCAEEVGKRLPPPKSVPWEFYGRSIVLLLKLFVVPIFVGLIAISGRFWGASVAGLLSGLPVIAGPLLWFLYRENGYEFAQSAVSSAVGGVVALSFYCFSYSWLCTRMDWKPALLLSYATFFFIAWVVENIALELNELAALACLVILLQLYLSPNLHNKPLLAPASFAEIMCRMVFALVLILSITMFAEKIGTTYSGIFATFPVAGSVIAIFSHRNHSPHHAIRSLKSMKQGLLSMLGFFYVVATFSGRVGFAEALGFGAILALLLQVLILLGRNYRKFIASSAGGGPSG